MTDIVCFPALEKVGRLGNQAWQVASTVGIARRMGAEPRFPESWSYRPWFSLPDEWFGDCTVGTPAPDLAVGLDPRERVYLQSLSLWEDVADEVRAAFDPSPAAAEILDGEVVATLPRPVLSVHVRRGDNAFDPGVPDKWRYHPLRPLSYYREAMALLAPQAASVACFSDDPAWCREHIEADWYSDSPARPKENEPSYATAPAMDWVDLQLMARCDLHVISNSSYAWWGAWLSDDPAPIFGWPWYGPALDYIDAAAMLPATWRCLIHPIGPPDHGEGDGGEGDV